MSLGIALKGPEGIVLAADSRVTLFVQIQQAGGSSSVPPILAPASFDNATKLLHLKDHPYVGAVTYGAGVIGKQTPRTAHSYLPEFAVDLGTVRLPVEDFAKRLGAFFMRQWTVAQMPDQLAPGEVDMVFLVGGYDEGAPYGRIFELAIPSHPTPTERIQAGEFGATWGGQREITDRIIQGFDSNLPHLVYDLLGTPQSERKPQELEQRLKASLSINIPLIFLPLQDCVDLAVFLVRSTILLQKWMIGIRGVGGAVDVATITRTDGFTAIQKKAIVAERYL
jgi:hypothetical protein